MSLSQRTGIKPTRINMTRERRNLLIMTAIIAPIMTIAVLYFFLIYPLGHPTYAILSILIGGIYTIAVGSAYGILVFLAFRRGVIRISAKSIRNRGIGSESHKIRGDYDMIYAGMIIGSFIGLIIIIVTQFIL